MQPVQAGPAITAVNSKQTKRLVYLVPLQTLLQSTMIDGAIVGGSLILVALLQTNWLLLVLGLLLVALVAWVRSQASYLMAQQRLHQTAAFLALGYLVGLFVVVLLFGDALIVPLILVEATLPVLLGVVYDLPQRRALMVGGVALYVALLASLVIALPTHLILNDLSRLMVIINVLFVGVIRILSTYRVVQAVFTEQTHESQRTLEMLRVLESDLKLRNAQLEQAAKASDEANVAKTQFLQHMSHELRSPLNTVIGLSEIIAEDMEAFPPEMVKEQARQVYKAGQHLLSVISDVLDIAKIESGTFQVYYEVIDPLVIIKDLEAIITGLRTRWPGIVFTMDIPQTLPTILAEDRRIRQILINLLDNAFKYTRQGTVSMCARADDEGILITVQDNGIGISKENYKRIFEPFEQVAGQQSIGTGLGLAITRHLVIQHGGLLTLESEAGHGSKFEMFLPKADSTFAEHGSGRILVVEGDKNLHTILAHHLKRAGYDPITLAATDEAREILREQEIAAVILDLYLPTIDVGWQFLQEITGPNAPWHCPIVVYSNVRQPERVTALGASYVEKPARLSAVVSTLAAAIRSATVETWD